LYDQGAGESDRSENDFALIGLLRFYTQDIAQIERLMKGSALVRPKWDTKRSGRTYLVYSIEHALQQGGETYAPPLRPRLGGTVSEGQGIGDDGSVDPTTAVSDLDIPAYTDVQCARLLARDAKQYIRDCESKGCWYVYDRRRWAQGSGNLVKPHVHALARRFHDLAGVT